jgi:uncharacterized UPF0160 family protein
MKKKVKLTTMEIVPRLSLADSTLKICSIGTHDGVFHCDEVSAIALLKFYLDKQYSKFVIVRTRVPSELDKCEYVVDVGCIFSANAERYDHHQMEFNETFNDQKKTKLSSCGLIYRQFGKDIIKEHLLNVDKTVKSFTDHEIEMIYNQFYNKFIEQIDALDNGINISGDELRYELATTCFSNRISSCNAPWYYGESDNNAEFEIALKMAETEIFSCISGLYFDWFKARVSIENYFKNLGHSEILVMDKFYPWKDHLFDLEKEYKIEKQIKFVIFKKGDDTWMVQGVPFSSTSFTARKSLCKDWWGTFKGVELSKISGIPGCVYVHHNGFCGVNLTKEGALEMAKKSL